MVQCEDNMTEWDTRSRRQWSDPLVGQQYRITMNVQSLISIAIDVSGMQNPINEWSMWTVVCISMTPGEELISYYKFEFGAY